MTWEEVTLKNIATVQTGPFGSQLHQEDYVESGTPIITVEHLGDNIILHQNLPCVSDEDKERLSKYSLIEGDIVFSRVGSVDRCAYVRKEEEGWLFSGRCLRIRVDKKKVNPRFLSFFFCHPTFKEHIRQIAVGATMPSLNTKLMNEIIIPLPPLETQKKIAAVLSSLDDKIELNTRMNKVLEEIAQVIFKRWFVEFEFPNEKGEPYRSSGGQMKESELGLIPEGWGVRTLGEICELQYGKALVEQDRKGGDYPVYGSNGVVGWHNEYLVLGPGIVVGRKGNPGMITWSEMNYYPIDTAFYVVPKDPQMGLHHLYYALKNLKLDKLDSDSAVPGLNRNTALSQKILIPSSDLIKSFELITKSIYSYLQINENEAKKLKNIRDILLPKLMNSDIEV